MNNLDLARQGGKGNDKILGSLPKGKKLEYIGSIKVKDLKGKGQGYLKGAKDGKVEWREECFLKGLCCTFLL